MYEQSGASVLAEDALSLEAIERARAELGERVLTTPVLEWEGPGRAAHLGENAKVFLKLELFQRSGSFKVRAAFLNMLRLSKAAREAGVAAASAGNHAIAVAYAAHALGCSAKLVMFAIPDPLRLQLCRQYGAEIVIAGSPKEAFEIVEQIARAEGRAVIHPYEGLGVALGTATLGLELCRQAPRLDAVVVPIGGGGLAAGVAAAVKAHWPACEVFGIEPEGAPSMFRSFAAGAPQALDRIDTIADSLGAPRALPFSYALCRKHVQGVELVSDLELQAAMRLIFCECKLAVEPAGAAALAGLLGPLRDRLRGARVGLIVCGANIDPDKYAGLLTSSGPAGQEEAGREARP